MPFVPDSCRTLLDVGCAGGAFGAGIKEDRQIEVWGVEPIEKVAKQARERLDHVVAAAFDQTADIPNAYFDVVLFNDSLEHFPDPFPPLELAKQKLRPGGFVVASIPNVRYIRNVRHFLFEKDWKYTDKGILDRTHLRFFTLKSMQRTFVEAGYDVSSITGINSHRWNLPAILLLRLIMGRFIADMRYPQFVVVAQPK